MRILLTGATGYVGRTLLPELDSARKELGGWFDKQRLQLKKILKPVAKLYRNG